MDYLLQHFLDALLWLYLLLPCALACALVSLIGHQVAGTPGHVHENRLARRCNAVAAFEWMRLVVFMMYGHPHWEVWSLVMVRVAMGVFALVTSSWFWLRSVHRKTARRIITTSTDVLPHERGLLEVVGRIIGSFMVAVMLQHYWPSHLRWFVSTASLIVVLVMLQIYFSARNNSSSSNNNASASPVQQRTK
jgi:small-conductance mechanosensitive channel